MTSDYFEMNFKTLEIQTNISLMDNIFDKTMNNNISAKEMADDYFYKLEIEQEEIVQKLTREQEEIRKNKEEKAEIHRKLSAYKLKHKMKQDSPLGKFHNALDKLKLLNLFTIGEHNEKHNNDDDSEKDEVPLIENKIDDNQFETEDEESENEAQNDETRQENIIEELNNESFSSASSNKEKQSKKKEMNEKNIRQLRKSERNQKNGAKKYGSFISTKYDDSLQKTETKKRNTEVVRGENRFEMTKIQNNIKLFKDLNKKPNNPNSNLENINENKPIEKIEKEVSNNVLIKEDDYNNSKKNSNHLSNNILINEDEYNNSRKNSIYLSNRNSSISKDNFKKEGDINLEKKGDIIFSKKNTLISKDIYQKKDELNSNTKQNFQILKKRNSLSNIFETKNFERNDSSENLSKKIPRQKLEAKYSKRNSVILCDSSNFQCKLFQDSKLNTFKKTFNGDAINNEIIPKLIQIEDKNVQIEKNNKNLKMETTLISEIRSEEVNVKTNESKPTLENLIIVKNHEKDAKKKEDESFSESESSEKSSQ